jgi:hypothetical protein
MGYIATDDRVRSLMHGAAGVGGQRYFWSETAISAYERKERWILSQIQPHSTAD